MAREAEIVYVNKMPPRGVTVRLLEAISSCSPEEIKKPNPVPDMHYFELYWYSKKPGGGWQKNILRLLYPTYRDAVNEREAMFRRLFGGTPDWVDREYESQIKKINSELKVARRNRENLKQWDI